MALPLDTHAARFRDAEGAAGLTPAPIRPASSRRARSFSLSWRELVALAAVLVAFALMHAEVDWGAILAIPPATWIGLWLYRASVGWAEREAARERVRIAALQRAYAVRRATYEAEADDYRLVYSEEGAVVGSVYSPRPDA